MIISAQDPRTRKGCLPSTPTVVAALLILALCIAPVFAAEYRVAPAGEKFSSVQDAVSFAAAGDTITVGSGTYNETLRIDKTLTLRGVNTGSGMPIIQTSAGGNTIEIPANGCTLSGFLIRNARMLSGIHITGDRNVISGNTIVSCSQGILLESADNNTLSDNNITLNIRSGIALEDSHRNIVENNSITKNSIGLSLDLYSAYNRVVRNNFDNVVNIASKSSTSRYNTETPVEYQYLGRSQASRMGNYWSDYHGTDSNGDGIGDPAYIIKVGVNQNAVLPVNQDSMDSFPLMDPVRFYHILPNGSGISGSPTDTPATVKPTRTPTSNANASVLPTLPGGDTAAIPDLLAAPVAFAALAIGVILVAVVVILSFRRRRTGGAGTVVAPAGPPAPGQAEDVTPAAPAVPAGDPVTSPEPVPEPAIPVPEPAAQPVSDPATTTLPDATKGSETGPPAAPLPYFPRELEAKYADIQLIGRGGIAWVYSALRISDGKRVAVKIPISFDEMTGKSFLNEIKVWEMLRHPNIVEITAVNILPVPYVEMEFVVGSLEAVKKPLPVWKAVYIVQGIADALGYAHERGIIHRDIKPHNVLVTDDLTPKITDWGMSKVLATDPRKSSIAGFSLSYAAPEQVSPADYGRTTDVRTDIYQLGVVFYELVTGSIPFGGESIVSVGNAILRETPILPSEYNPDAAAVDRIIMKCLEKDPAKRYQSAAELLRALAGYLDEDEP